VKRTEFGDASETGLLDIRRRQWCRELLEFIDPVLVERLPPVTSSRTPQGVLRPDVAAAWGLREGVLVSAGGANEMMAALGAGAVIPGTIGVRLNGGSAICGVSRSPLIDPHGRIAAYCDATDHWLPFAGNGRSAGLVAEVQQHYGWNAEQMEAAIAAASPGSGGLMFLSAVSPGRAPYVPAGSGLLYGIEGGNFSAINVARAAAEAVVHDLGKSLKRMKDLGLAPAEVRMMAGAGGNRAWRQILADVLGLPVLAARQSACPSVGAALQAAVTFLRESGENLGYDEITAYAVEPDESIRCEPDPARHAYYEELLDRQRVLAGILHDEQL
jgi:xylulokinase